MAGLGVGCPEGFALAVSGVGDSQLAQRVRSAKAAIAEMQEEAFESEFSRILSDRRAGGWAHHCTPAEATEDCLGGCGSPAAVKIVKRCGCCVERAPCHCPPQWCSTCLLKWWMSSNKERTVRITAAPGTNIPEAAIDPRWQVRWPSTALRMSAMSWSGHPTKSAVTLHQAKCPTCRAHFCLNDVLPLHSVAAGTGADGGPGRLLTVGHGEAAASELFGLLAKRGGAVAGLVDLRPSLQVLRQLWCHTICMLGCAGRCCSIDADGPMGGPAAGG